MQFTDTHAHLTNKAYKGQLQGVLERSRQAGVARWITVGTDVADSAASLRLAQANAGMHCTVGVHPHEAGKVADDYLSKLRELAAQKKVCALGEVGLDYHYDFSERQTQRRIFEEQLTLAQELSLPVVVHCREAFEDGLAILDAWGCAEAAVVFHCFSGNAQQAEQVIDRGYFVSLTGTITFKNAAEGRQVAQWLPMERVFLETDCPYLSPEPKRKVKPNEPALLVHTAAKLAELRGMSVGEIAEATEENSRLFFGK